MYNVIGQNNLENILETVLANRGVEDTESFLNPSIEHEIPYENLKDIDMAVELLLKHKEGNVWLIVDRDLDGFTSTATMQLDLEKRFPNMAIENVQHIKRENGLVEHVMEVLLKNHKKKPIDLVILPDASSNDKEQHEALNALGIDVLVLDHHIVDSEITDNPKTVVINPQLSPEYENKQISGAGVVYKFLQALDSKMGTDFADDNIDLVAIGNIGDSMDMRNLETNSIVSRGLKEIKNDFLKELIFKNKHMDRQLSRHALSWDVLPKVNALIRVGTQEELQFVYEALLGREGTFENSRARNPKNKIETWAQKATRLCTNAQSKQKRMRDKIVEQVVAHVEENNLNKHSVLFIPIKDLETEGLTGYVAGNLVNRYGKPVTIAIYKEEEKVYMGSSRGLETVLDDYKEYLNNSGVVSARGHANAHGVTVHEDDLETLFKYLEETTIVSSNKEKATIPIDFVIDYKEVTSELIKELDELEVYWGKGVEPPRFLIRNAEIPMSPFNYRETVSKVNDRGKVVTAFSVPDEIKDNAGENKIIHADLVATLGINRFFNNIDDQILVEKFDIKKVEEIEDTFGFLF